MTNSNSSSLPVSVDALLDKAGASKAGPAFVVDTEAARKRLAARMRTPFRTVRGLFRVPVGASNSTKESLTKTAIGKWVAWLGKEHWALVSDVSITGPYQATDADGNVPLLGVNEYRMQAAFRYSGPAPKPVRYEFPRDGVKQDPEHRLTLRDAMRVWGVAAPALKE